MPDCFSTCLGTLPAGGTTALVRSFLAAFCIGMSKAGFSGISLISVFIFADLYGKASVGLALPLLIFADIAVYPTFHRHGSWAPVWKLLPATLAGLAIGWWLLGVIPDGAPVKRAIGGCILGMIAIQGLRLWKPLVFDRMANSRAFGTAAGIAGGLTTTLANAAGPVIQLYLLSRRLPKMELLGIGARFFLLVNILKLPLTGQLDLWNRESLLQNAKLLPGVVIGIVAGRWLIRYVPQRAFEGMVLFFSAVAAGKLLLG